MFLIIRKPELMRRDFSPQTWSAEGIFCEKQSFCTCSYSGQTIQKLHDYSWCIKDPNWWALLRGKICVFRLKKLWFLIASSWWLSSLIQAEVYGNFLQEHLVELVNWRIGHQKITERGLFSCVKIGTSCKIRLKDAKITIIAISCCSSRFYLIFKKYYKGARKL